MNKIGLKKANYIKRKKASKSVWPILAVYGFGALLWSSATLASVEIVSPQVNESIATAKPEFVWLDQSTASHFQFQARDIVTRELFTRWWKRADICDGSYCRYSPPDMELEFSRNHWWRVRARANGVWESWPAVTRFHYPDDLVSHVPVIRPLGATIEQNPLFSWNHVEGVSYYYVWGRDNVTSERIVLGRYKSAEVCSGSVCELDAGVEFTASNSIEHQWMIRAYNSGGWNKWSDKYKFTVAETRAKINCSPTTSLSEISAECTDIDLSRLQIGGSGNKTLVISSAHFQAPGTVVIRGAKVLQGSIDRTVSLDTAEGQDGGQSLTGNIDSCVVLQRGNVELVNFELENCDRHGLHIQPSVSGNIKITNITIDGTGEHGIVLGRHSGDHIDANITIDGGTISDIGVDGIAGSIDTSGSLLVSNNFQIQRVDRNAKEALAALGHTNACNWRPFDSSVTDYIRNNGRAFGGDCVHIQDLRGTLTIQNSQCDHSDWPTKNGFIVQNQHGATLGGTFKAINNKLYMTTDENRCRGLQSQNFQSRDPKGIQIENINDVEIRGNEIDRPHIGVSINGTTTNCTIESNTVNKWFESGLAGESGCDTVRNNTLTRDDVDPDPETEGECIDTDPVGDGWGWNGVSSCRIESTNTTCVDTDPVGDGWGWDGTSSCRIEPTQTECIDTDPVGDGWGWDGTSSCRVDSAEECIDTDPVGDGWGWNGTSSCQIPVTNRVCVDTTPVGDGWGWDGVESCRI